EAHVQGAWVLRRQRQPEAAVESARAALALEPTYAPAHYVLALAHWDAGRLDEAEGAFRDALANPHPDRDTHLTEYARLLSSLKRSAEALPLLDEAQRLSPNLATVAEVRGINLVELGRTDEARAAFREALRLNPHNVKALNYLGWLDLRAARGAEALEHFRAALALAPTDEYARAKLPEALRLRLPVYGHVRRAWARLRPWAKRHEGWALGGLVTVLMCSALVGRLAPGLRPATTQVWTVICTGVGTFLALRLLWALLGRPLLNTLLLLDPQARAFSEYDPVDGIVLASLPVGMLGLAVCLAVVPVSLPRVALVVAALAFAHIVIAQVILRPRSEPRNRRHWELYCFCVGGALLSTLLLVTPLATVAYVFLALLALGLAAIALVR
ncbi:MAG TPA: tetratricopeptide repeat protein, partial [Roseiflexaceae bacterium]|nr:tetratricopeptide repeat protein [Roseiflexaceae bacterium]